MKKIKVLAVVTVSLLVAVIGVFVALAALGILKIEQGENGGIIFAPLNKKDPVAWQTTETEGDKIAVIKTELGNITVKLGDNAAAEKFMELQQKGAFAQSKFSVLAEDMFIQSTADGESFDVPQTELACIYGAIGFVMDEEKACPQFFIITAEELSGISLAYLEEAGFSEEKKEAYKAFGGIPEYEGKTVIFGQVTEGMETVMKICAKENSGYAGGYSAAEPVAIIGTEIFINLPNSD